MDLSWMQELGFTDDDTKGGTGRIFGATFRAVPHHSFQSCRILGPEATFSWGLAAGVLAGIGWVATALGILYLFERRSLRLYLINAGYHAVTFTVMGGILRLWQ